MSPESISAIGWIVVAFVAAFEALTLYAVFQLLKDGVLAGLLIESDGSKASLARLQALIFTFVVAALFVIFSLDIGNFVEIPESVLGLLGISGGTFLISKGISKEKDGPPPAGMGPATAEPPPVVPDEREAPQPDGRSRAEQNIDQLRRIARRQTWKLP